jgi:hypothetical protein
LQLPTWLCKTTQRYCCWIKTINIQQICRQDNGHVISFACSSMLSCIVIPSQLAYIKSDNVGFPFRLKRRTRERLSWSQMTLICWKHYRRLTSWSAKKPSSTSISSSEKIYCLQAKTSHQARSRKHSPNCRLMMTRCTSRYTLVQSMAELACLFVWCHAQAPAYSINQFTFLPLIFIWGVNRP